MSNKNSKHYLLSQLRRILPFLGRNVSRCDRELAFRRFRRLYTEDPVNFSDALEEAVEDLSSIYPMEMMDLMHSTTAPELDEVATSALHADGTTTAIYGMGFFAYGLQNQPLASEKITPEDAEMLKSLLCRCYFDETAADITIYENIVPLTHWVVMEPMNCYRFIRYMDSVGDTFAPESPLIDLPGTQGLYEEEDADKITARFRIILFTVRQKDPQKPVLIRPWRFNGLLVPQGKNTDRMAYSTAAIAESPWGSAFTAYLSQHCGRGLRYAVTEPYLLGDTIWQLDYVTGLKRVVTALTRTALDENVSPEDIIVSLGAFTDPLRGYSELRVGFALPHAPDDLVGGVPMPLPSPENRAQPEEFAKLVIASFELDGISLRYKPDPDCPSFVAEPDTVDRIYNTIHNIQKPLSKRSDSPIPGMPSMLLN